MQVGHDNIEGMAHYLATIRLPFTVLEPPSLREEMQHMGERLLKNARSGPVGPGWVRQSSGRGMNPVQV
jgi:hypothetical protein